jgi:hypothetical protein
MCILDPTSIAAALTLTRYSGRSSVVLLGIANPPFNHEQEGLGYANRHLLIGIAAEAASPLSSPHAPMGHVF